MKNSKLLNNLIFQLLLIIIFSIRLLATEPVDIWKDNSEIKIKSTKLNEINLESEKSSFSQQPKNGEEV